jgi:hypothetical protein
MGGVFDYRELETKIRAQTDWFRETQLRARRAWTVSIVVDLALGNWTSKVGAWGGRLRRHLIPVTHDGGHKIWEVGDATYERLFGRGDIHQVTAAQMFRKMEEAVTAEERSAAQTASFDSLYGGVRVDTGRFDTSREFPFGFPPPHFLPPHRSP